MYTPTYTPDYLDVTQALDSRTLMGEMRGHDAWDRIQARLSSMHAANALILDMSSASMLDYGFSGYAFGSLFSDQHLCHLCRHVIFVLPPPSRNAFFQGVLKATQRPVASYSQSRDMFVRAGLNCKIAASRRSEIDFIGALSDDETAVLNAVNCLKCGLIEQIVERAGLRPEKVHTDLVALVSKGFVMDHQVDDCSSYVSYNTFLELPE